MKKIKKVKRCIVNYLNSSDLYSKIIKEEVKYILFKQKIHLIVNRIHRLRTINLIGFCKYDDFLNEIRKITSMIKETEQWKKENLYY